MWCTLCLLLPIVLWIGYHVYLFKFRKPTSWEEYNGEWAVITGASDGIGEGYARALAKRGMNVIIMARTLAKLEKIAENIRAMYRVRVHAVSFDFSQPLSAYSEINELLQSDGFRGKVTVLVNNVGGSGLDALTHTSETLKWFVDRKMEDADACFQINIRPTIAMTQMVASSIRACGLKRGRIINISSVAGTTALPLSAPYSGSKGFINNFTRSLVPELSTFGIKIEAHAPGNVRTVSNAMPLGGDCCVVATYVEASLNMFGTGNIVYPYLPHFLQALTLRVIPECVSLSIVLRKRRKDKTAALSELERKQGGNKKSQ